MRRFTALPLALALASAPLGACEQNTERGMRETADPEQARGHAEAQQRRERPAAGAGERAQMMDTIRSAVAVLHPTQGNDERGIVRFEQQGDQVRVIADVTGLEPGTRHGFHVHEFGDCSAPDATSAGDHFNPGDAPHGLPPGHPHHAGDMGNIEVDQDGRARLDQRFEGFSIAGQNNPVIGRAVIVHAQPDSGRGPSGEAGARLACGVIGVAQPSR